MISPSGERLTLTQFIAGAFLKEQISIVSSLNAQNRLDAEYYLPKFLRYEKIVASTNGGLLENFIDEIIQPSEFIRNYIPEDTDGAIFWTAKNIRPGFINTDNVSLIDWSIYNSIPNAHVNEGDILITRTGANAGDCAVVPNGTRNVAVSSHTLRLIPNDTDIGYAIGIFFASSLGREVLFRTVSGSSRPQITKEALKQLFLPNFSRIATEIKNQVQLAIDTKAKSKRLYAEAEELLLAALGLDELDLSPQLSYTAMLEDVTTAERLDPDYFQPQIIQVLRQIESQSPIRLRRWGRVKSGYPWKSVYFIEENGEPFVRIRDCKPGAIDISTLTSLDPAYARGEVQKKAQAGDIVIGMDGVKYFYGSLIIDPCYVNQRVAWVSPRKDRTIPSEYILLIVNSLVGQSQLLREMTIAQTVGHITNGAVRNLLIPLLSTNQINMLGDLIKTSIEAKQEAKQLLETAKQRVEQMILRESLAPPPLP